MHDGKWPERVRQIEGSHTLLTSIDRERFPATGFGKIQSTGVLMNIPELPDCVRQLKSVILGAAHRHGFFMKLPRRLALAEISLDLPKALECTHEIQRSARLPSDLDGPCPLHLLVGRRAPSVQLRNLHLLLVSFGQRLGVEGHQDEPAVPLEQNGNIVVK